MSPFRRHRWFLAAAGITLAFAVVSFVARPGDQLTAVSDLTGLFLLLAAAGAALANIRLRPSHERSFWGLMALGFALWATNQGAWCHSEILLRRAIPDPYVFDIILFFHVVPMIAATAWRPDILKTQGRIYLSALSFLTLLGWWIFLYAFIVFPHQYVVLNVEVYNRYYDWLYGLENLLLLAVLLFAALGTSSGWRRLYLHLLGARMIYTVGSQWINRAVADNTYYSGSLYDIPFIATLAWMLAATLSAREWELVSVEPPQNRPWQRILPRLAMLAILSFPALGLWTIFLDHSPALSREFRLFAVLAAMFLLGAFVFMRQYFQVQALMALLQDSRRTYDSQVRLQNQLVQKEKLASLGTLVAGAAQEIDHPLKAIMSYSERLWAEPALTDQQHTLLRKIVNQARRTRDLVADLLRFSQQSAGEKTAVDLTTLLHRATQMLESRRTSGRTRVGLSVAQDFPQIRGNANQLFQVFVEVIENAMDALEESGGGSLTITAQRQGSDAVLLFADTGPGLREPQRVFDPFYTTKPVGKGTGLGLSAVYGIIQEHNGQITCQNKPEGGALFTIRLPAAEQAATAAGL